jgi:hypothetical protein
MPCARETECETRLRICELRGAAHRNKLEVMGIGRLHGMHKGRECRAVDFTVEGGT